MENTAIVRKAQITDMDRVYELIKELADFENMPNGPKITPKVLRYDGFERENPAFHCLVVELDNEVIGYAIFYFIYPTWEGVSLFLEDIYIQAQYRNQTIGSQLFKSVVQFADDKNCARMDFHVLAWNRAISFYKRHLAHNMTEIEDWNYFRLNKEAMNNILNT